MLLDQWFKAEARSHPEVFPRQNPGDYLTLYDSTLLFLEPYHDEVERAAMRHDGGYLTVHGKEHIRTVIERASQLLFNLDLDLNPASDSGLTPYHAYLLLIAIQLHDVGNALGRKNHERKIGEIVREGKNVIGMEAVEKNVIQRVAAAHGGYVSRDTSNKDTIGGICLQKYESLVNRKVPIQLLAAVLRLADELADDYTRASLISKRLGTIPRESEIYHKYAECLHSVMVNRNERRIELFFRMHVDDAVRMWGKGNEQTFLLDEIHRRTWKMYRECLYCMRYMRATQPHMRVLEAVKVNIQMVRGDQDVYTPYDPDAIEPIEYTIEERGYPRAGGHLSDFVSDLEPRDGEALKRQLERDHAGLTGITPEDCR